MRPMPQGLAILAVALAASAASAQPPAVRLETSPPLLIGCGTEPRPFFRVSVNGVDADGRAAPIALGSDRTRGFRVARDGQDQPVVHVSDSGPSDLYVLLLLDTSGSMLQPLEGRRTRFDVARDAIRQSLGAFVEGTDHIAVVPFDSRQVRARIQSAPFLANRRAVEAQINALERPARNTALYSAIAEALPRLAEPRRAGHSAALVVFSDGANDVGRPGDDPGLLGGSAGLATMLALVTEARVPVFTVGFTLTDTAAIGTLRQIAQASGGRYYDATSQRQLTEILQVVRQRFTDQVDLLFGPAAPSRAQLGRRPLQFRVALQASGTTLESSREPPWVNPGLGDPAADTACTAAEAAAIQGLDVAPETGGSSRPLIVFLTYAVVIAALWFGAPRFMWPESYVRRPVIPQPTTPVIAGGAVSVSPPPQPQPRWPERSQPRTPAAPPSPRPPSEPGVDQTVTFPSRGGSRPAPSPPAARPPRRGGDDQGGDETIYMPPGKNPYKK
jgi:Mg-chelatase subunit ChlD